jgi:hypothetical protein
MPPARFFLFNLLGAVLWTGLFGLAGYFGGLGLTSLVGEVEWHEWKIAILILATGALYTLWRSRGKDLQAAWKSIRAPDTMVAESVRTVMGNSLPAAPRGTAPETGPHEK